MNNKELWQATLAQIQLSISPANFATWFKDTKIVQQKDGEALISVANSFAKEWLENKYGKTILKILHSLDENIKKVNYKVGQIEVKSSPSQAISLPKMGQLEFQGYVTHKETHLNPRYTFDNFVVGPFNDLAQATSWAVSQNPGAVYNPLFIYGKVGLGKTHLLQAIGNEIVINFSSRKVKYIPSEKFASEMVSAIRKHSVEKFKSKYRMVDVLILDDVQFLAGKEKTQEEFFHVFNNLYETNKQIVLSSDRPPKAIPALATRLRSRFEGGMIADIGYPDYETRMAILEAKCQERKFHFPEEILDYIASNIQKNIRELEGALIRLSAFQKLQNHTPDLEITKSLLKNLIVSPKKIITPKKVIKEVAEFYDVKVNDLRSSSRKREIVRPRQIAMYLLREELKTSYPFIGRKFGGRDHTTVIHAYRKISQAIEKNENLAEEIHLIKQGIFSV
jgi:chromosomal replication initiator protein